MPKRILVPLCMDDSDKTVLEVTKKIASTSKSEITLLFVTSNDITSSNGDHFDEVNQELDNAGINTGQPILVKGDEVDETIRVLREKNMNLVVMAGIGEGDEDFGRKTILKLIRKTEVPIWEVKPGSSTEIQRILCPVDFSEQSGRALKNAVALASLFKSELLVLSVYEPVTGTSVFISDGEEDAENEHKKLHDTFLKSIDFHKVEWNAEIRNGKPAEEIIAAAKDSNTDLLIMGSAGRSGIQRKVIGSITEKIVKALPCSVIAVRDQDILNVESIARLTDG